jgi:methylphosphotriester-DNA--protein-cysteine methyltransferase
MLNSLPQWQSAEGPLRRFVLGFWQGGRAVEQGETFRILPDGSLDLVWALGASPSSIAYGTTTRPRDAALAEGALYFGVRFRPGTAHRFLDLIDLAQLTDRDAPCALRHDRDLAARLAEAQRFEARVALIAAQFDRLAAEADAADLSEAAARMIAAHGGQVRIEDLAGKLGVTRRHLERECRRDLGLSPKMLARITRFRRAASLLSGGAVCSGADLAAAGGYVDQAHLIREFQEFAGTTPRLFRT